MMRVDTHQHLWDLKQFPYSWTEALPPLRRSFRIGDYLAAAEGSGIKTLRPVDVEAVGDWL